MQRTKIVGYAMVVWAAMLTPRGVTAQEFHALLYPRLANGFCELVDDGGQVSVAIHMENGGGIAPPVVGARFRVSPSPGFTGTMIYFVPGFSSFGNPTDGIHIDFISCSSVPSEPLVTLTYQLFGTSSTCSTIDIVPYPGDETVMVWPCDAPIAAAMVWGPIMVNNAPGCNLPGWCILATRPSTWGRVKALYR